LFSDTMTDASGLTLLAALDWKKYTEERDTLLQSLQVLSVEC